MAVLHFGRRGSATNLAPLAMGSVSYRHEFKADFDDLPGDLSIDDFTLWGSLPPLSWDRSHLIPMFSYRGTWLNGSGGSPVPDDDLHAFRLPLIFLQDVSEDFLWGAMVMPGYSGDASGWQSDALTFAAALGAGYMVNPELRVFAGVYYSHAVDNEFLVPGVAFSWRPHADWEVYLYPPIAGINYNLGDHWLAGLFGRYDATAWFVEGGRRAPDLEATLRGTRVGLKLEGRVWNRIWAYAAGGYSFGRELEVDRTRGRTLFDEDIDNSPFVQFGFNLRY